MARNTRLRIAGIAALATGSATLAQNPGAVLMPARVVATPANVIARSATPDMTIPAAPADSVPVPAFHTDKPDSSSKPSWVGSQWSGIKSYVSGTTDAKPYQPFPDINGKQPTPTQPQTRQASAQGYPTGPLPSTYKPRTPEPAASKQPQAPSGVYAGPPAYRWYGWGSCTPGANSYAPTGVYPRASANWYSQTGATPGAFPVPVNYTPREIAGTEPPAYTADANRLIPEMQQFPVTQKPTPTVEEPIQKQFVPPTMDARSVPSTFAPPSIGGPTPIASTPPTVTPPTSTTAPTELAPAPAPASPEQIVETPSTDTLNWTAGTKPAQVPVTTEPVPAPVVPPVKTGEEPSWERGKATPAPSVIRSEFRADTTPDFETTVRNTCVDKVRRVDVTHTSGKEVVVRFLVENAEQAREAAVRVMQLPGAKEYQIKFEAVIVTK